MSIRKLVENERSGLHTVPGNVLHFVDEGLVPDGVEGLGLGGGAVQVVLVRVDRHVRVYRLVVYNGNAYLHTL